MKRKSIILVSIMLLLVFTASTIAGCQKPTQYDEYHQAETIFCDYERIGKIAEMVGLCLRA